MASRAVKLPLDDPENGIHRAKIWEIGFFSLNNFSSNCYYLMFLVLTYYLNGILGVAILTAGTIVTVMRLWDGITDPFIGYLVDKTNGRFGKNRPFIFLGSLISFIFSGLIFYLVPSDLIPQEFKFVTFIVLYMIYIIGYTFQTVVTKSALTCLTNDPKQRPLTSIFDSVYGLILFSFISLYTTNTLGLKHATITGQVSSSLENPAYYQEVWRVLGIISVVTAILAIIGIWRKDNNKYFGTGKPVLVTFKDYWLVLKNNKAIQMLVVAASTNKLGGTIQINAPVLIIIFGLMMGNYALYAQTNAAAGILQVVLTILAISTIAVKFGQKRALQVGAIVASITAILLYFLLTFGNPKTYSLELANGISLFTVLFFTLFVLMKVAGTVVSSISISMTADCADYEVARSGKYVPGLMGTLFSSIDKFVSSLATTVVSIVLLVAGFSDLPTEQSEPTSELINAGLFMFIAIPVICWVINIIAMKFYPLTKEKMASIQEKISEIKARS